MGQGQSGTADEQAPVVTHAPQPTPQPRPQPQPQRNYQESQHYNASSYASSTTRNEQHSSASMSLEQQNADHQRRLMEEELRKKNLADRQITNFKSNSSNEGSRTWVETSDGGDGKTTKTMIVRKGDAGDLVPQWQNADGSMTKATTSGTYDDPEGHKIHYTKDVYTSSDPGKEFSMVTEEEKKVVEVPIQPGVISRHTTTKYYKKSTITSAATTLTTGGEPITTPASIGGGPVPLPSRAIAH